MSPTLMRVLGYVLVLAPIAIDVISRLANKQPIDVSAVLAAVSAALGGSQVLRRVGDVPAAEVEAKVEAKVAEVVASMPPAAHVPVEFVNSEESDMGALDLLRPTKPYWRWGHCYPMIEGVYTCQYCGHVDVFRQRVTKPPCPGPRKK